MSIPSQFHNADGELVEYDGSPLEWRVSAYGLVLQNDAILLLKNETEKLYDVPGGGVEFGETIEQALQRESLEEAGATVSKGSLVHMAQDYFYHREQQQFFQTLQLFYQAELENKLTQPTEESTEWVGFVQLDELQDFPVPSAVSTAIKQLRSLL